MKNILEITWNYSPSVMEGHDGRMDCYPEEYQIAKSTDDNIIEIREIHEDLRVYYEIEHINGTIEIIFNPNTVLYLKK